MEILASFGSPLSDLVRFPFEAYSSLSVDSYTLELLSYIPRIGFIALLIAGFWSQARKYPTGIFENLNNENARKF